MASLCFLRFVALVLVTGTEVRAWEFMMSPTEIKNILTLQHLLEMQQKRVTPHKAVTPINQLVAEIINQEMVKAANLSSHGFLAKLDPQNKNSLLIVGRDQGKIVKYVLDPEVGMVERQRLMESKQTTTTTATTSKPKIRLQKPGGLLSKLPFQLLVMDLNKKAKESRRLMKRSSWINRNKRDLVYEAMKMRSKPSVPFDKDAIKTVGGGFLEKQLAKSGDILDLTGPGQYMTERSSIDEIYGTESREMQCCGDVTVAATGGVKECHPYVLGNYKKIGVCGGKAFFQHDDNRDIFLYYACGAWYIGLEIGTCGGWIMVKSVEQCVSSLHQTQWKYFDNGNLLFDDSFTIKEECQLYDDFRPIPTKKPADHWASPPPSFHPMHHHNTPAPLSSTNLDKNEDKEPIKHEHVHYHIKIENDDDKNKLRLPTMDLNLPSASPQIVRPEQSVTKKTTQHDSPISINFNLKRQGNIPLFIDDLQANDDNGKQKVMTTKQPELLQHPHIFINNFLPTTPSTTTTTTSTTSTASTASSPVYELRNPYASGHSIIQAQYLHQLNKPSSDLQHPFVISGSADRFQTDMYNKNNHQAMAGIEVLDGNRRDSSNLVGYIIKKRRPRPVEEEVDSNDDAKWAPIKMEDTSNKDNIDDNDFYFPVKQSRDQDVKDTNSRRLD